MRALAWQRAQGGVSLGATDQLGAGRLLGVALGHRHPALPRVGPPDQRTPERVEADGGRHRVARQPEDELLAAAPQPGGGRADLDAVQELAHAARLERGAQVVVPAHGHPSGGDEQVGRLSAAVVEQGADRRDRRVGRRARPPAPRPARPPPRPGRRRPAGWRRRPGPAELVPRGHDLVAAAEHRHPRDGRTRPARGRPRDDGHLVAPTSRPARRRTWPTCTSSPRRRTDACPRGRDDGADDRVLQAQDRVGAVRQLRPRGDADRLAGPQRRAERGARAALADQAQRSSRPRRRPRGARSRPWPSW